MVNPGENEVNTENAHGHSTRRRILLLLGIALLVVGAIARSAIATSLDGFTYDEAYHIGAGVAYVKTGDFRLNPEHPPLVKLWVGAYLSFFDYNLSPYRPLSDKVDERGFVEEDVYNQNDPDVIQSRARHAMFALNGLLMLVFGLAVWRVFGDVMAIAATAFLAIDPTVAAHLPVVMTDLPVALLAGAAVILSVNAFRTWKPLDLLFASLALGLALGSKHSAIIVFAAIALIGLAMVLILSREAMWPTRLGRVGAVAGVLVTAVVLLWSLYFFRFYESPASAEDQFNRPLAEKIADVKSPVYRFGLNAMSRGFLFPRSYTWGMADTIRAGAEGRIGSPMVFGTLYYGRAPWFYVPGVIAVKLPLGLLALTIIGLILLIIRRRSEIPLSPILGLGLFSLIFAIIIIRGSSYGGIRHALPIYPLLAILASVTIYYAFKSRSYLLGTIAAAGLIGAVISSVPVMRPWEYFNELVGGTANGHKYFDDEGVDLCQRSTEAVKYYHEVLKPQGVTPFVFYLMPSINDPAKSLEAVKSSSEKWDADTAMGVFILGANELSPGFWHDTKAFRDAQPIARFGSLFVFEGAFDIRPLRAQGLAYRAAFQIFGPEPNIEKAIQMLEESAALDPRAFFVSLEIGNQYLKLGKREQALAAYQSSLENVPPGDVETSTMLADQIERIKTGELKDISPLRNPSLE